MASWTRACILWLYATTTWSAILFSIGDRGISAHAWFPKIVQNFPTMHSFLPLENLALGASTFTCMHMQERGGSGVFFNRNLHQLTNSLFSSLFLVMIRVHAWMNLFPRQILPGTLYMYGCVHTWCIYVCGYRYVFMNMNRYIFICIHLFVSLYMYYVGIHVCICLVLGCI